MGNEEYGQFHNILLCEGAQMIGRGGGLGKRALSDGLPQPV
ncbi:hypothetical protein HMPREF9120_02372 [Neisseria sp. oral taxon 020 str. F0370]|nr:hypothetical protein HMPREF9120_02372 [Neisseria sp. oral taxon 020 str. F0370]